MIKLLICLASALLLAVTVLQLRQQRLELRYQANKLHNQIAARQAELWNQQLQIAIYTAPNSINKTVSDHQMRLSTPTPLPAGTVGWMDDPTAAEDAAN
jgi:cell division protein FtsL